MKIKDLSCEERPREKLMSIGKEGLSNIELLAIILKAGCKNHNVIELSRLILSKVDNSLTKLSQLSINDLKEIKGIGKDKAVSVMAVFELGRRFVQEKNTNPEATITSPKTVFQIMQPVLKALDHEECWILYLNKANKIILKYKHSQGNIDSTIIDVKTIVKLAIDNHSTGLIIVHNHPSNNPMPGSSDIKQTQKLKNALSHFDITLVDHIIICNDEFYSFNDHAVL